MVANPFARKAFKQGEVSEVRIEPGQSLKLVYAASFHSGANYDPASEFEAFQRLLR